AVGRGSKRGRIGPQPRADAQRDEREDREQQPKRLRQDHVAKALVEQGRGDGEADRKREQPKAERAHKPTHGDTPLSGGCGGSPLSGGCGGSGRVARACSGSPGSRVASAVGVAVVGAAGSAATDLVRSTMSRTSCSASRVSSSG